ncbi:Zinc finger protein [Yarrowia sp. B02]|nr:Zinc finger protein [Yarrowia sp. B02]
MPHRYAIFNDLSIDQTLTNQDQFQSIIPKMYEEPASFPFEASFLSPLSEPESSDYFPSPVLNHNHLDSIYNFDDPSGCDQSTFQDTLSSSPYMHTFEQDSSPMLSNQTFQDMSRSSTQSDQIYSADFSPNQFSIDSAFDSETPLFSQTESTPETTEAVSEFSDTDSSPSYVPSPIESPTPVLNPCLAHSHDLTPSMEYFTSILPKNVPLAQKPQSTPLLPTNPASAVFQLHKSRDMWHKASLTKKGVFICTSCRISSKTLVELAMHFDSHGLVRKSKCEVSTCPWSVVGFSTRSEKNRHNQSQHSDFNFPCQACGRRFGRCDSLKRHMKLVHNVKKDGVKKMSPSSPASDSEAPLRWDSNSFNSFN